MTGSAAERLKSSSRVGIISRALLASSDVAATRVDGPRGSLRYENEYRGGVGGEEVMWEGVELGKTPSILFFNFFSSCFMVGRLMFRVA